MWEGIWRARGSQGLRTHPRGIAATPLTTSTGERRLICMDTDELTITAITATAYFEIPANRTDPVDYAEVQREFATYDELADFIAGCSENHRYAGTDIYVETNDGGFDVEGVDVDYKFRSEDDLIDHLLGMIEARTDAMIEDQLWRAGCGQ